MIFLFQLISYLTTVHDYEWVGQRLLSLSRITCFFSLPNGTFGKKIESSMTDLRRLCLITLSLWIFIFITSFWALCSLCLLSYQFKMLYKWKKPYFWKYIFVLLFVMRLQITDLRPRTNFFAPHSNQYQLRLCKMHNYINPHSAQSELKIFRCLVKAPEGFLISFPFLFFFAPW